MLLGESRCDVAARHRRAAPGGGKSATWHALVIAMAGNGVRGSKEFDCGLGATDFAAFSRKGA
jgi:hypothetical protein